MRRALKIILWIVAALVALPIVAVVAVGIALNTEAGRHFVAHEIDALTGGEVRITGLSGHFPKYIAAKRIAIADRDGVYLTIDDAVLRWSPLALLHRAVNVEDLTAHSIDLARLPAPSGPSKPPTSTSTSPGAIPKGTLTLRHLRIDRLAIGKAVTGRPIALKITGHAKATALTDINLVLDATPLGAPGTYRLHASLDADKVDAKLAVHEPPGGLIAGFAGISQQPELREKPLGVTLTIQGPRDHAALVFASALGDLKAHGTGTLNLSETAPGGDVTITIPELAPYAALGKQALGGRTVLHFVAKHRAGTTDFHFDEIVEITRAAKPVPVLVGKRATMAGDFTIANGVTTIRQLTLDMAALKARISGTVGPSGVAVHGTLDQPDIGLVEPQLSGHLGAIFDLSGPTTDLALRGTIDGVVTAKGVQSGPFHLGIDVAHLPNTPAGTITGEGSLYNAPLSIAADFARRTDGSLDLDLKKLSWKSLSGQGRLTRAAGAMLPDGTLHVAMTRIADLAHLLNMDIAGSLQADFAHQTGQPAKLNLVAHDLREGKTGSLREAKIDATIDHLTTDPAIDATARLSGIKAPSAAGTLNLTAKGTLSALAVTAAGDFTNLAGQPAKLSLAGTVNGTTRIARLEKLEAAARGVTARLLGPATIEAEPLAVRNLALGLGGLGGSARITADGTIQPKLDLKATIERLPASIARVADPSLDVNGRIDATAHLTGSLTAPTGTITLDGQKLGVAKGPGAGLPPADIKARETLLGHAMRGNLTASLDTARLTLDGTTPLSMTGPMDLTLRLDHLPASLVRAIDPKLKAAGTLAANARLSGTPRDPRGTVDLNATGMRLLDGPASSLPPAELTAHETLGSGSANGRIHLTLGDKADLTLAGTAPLSATGPLDLTLAGKADLRLLAPITEAQGTRVTGTLTPDLRIGGTAAQPQVSGRMTLAGGSFENITSGFDLSKIDALVTASGQTVTIDHVTAKAGSGTIKAEGTIGLHKPMPIDLRIAFAHASPISSAIITEKLGGGIAITGDVQTGTKVAGQIDIEKANIEIPKGLPPSVAKLDIRKRGEKPPPPPAPARPIALDLTIDAHNQVFIRGNGLYANLGGKLRLRGTAAKPVPSGGFHLIRGNFSLGGKTLDLTKGTIRFDGTGFLPLIDLEISGSASDGTVSTLAVTGKADAPKINLSSNPSLPSDQVLAHLLYGSSTENLSAFQAASLAASLAQLAGFGGGGPDAIGSVRKALGLDELSIGGESGSPTVNAGRYVAPGIYVGAEQSATGGGTKAKVEINLYKGLKLKTEVESGGGSSAGSTGGTGESVGLTYQFNY